MGDEERRPFGNSDNGPEHFLGQDGRVVPPQAVDGVEELPGGLGPYGDVRELKENGEESDLIARFSASGYFSGPLPSAEMLSAYEPDVQQKIIDWAERQVRAQFDDESRRLDRLVDAEIRQSSRAQAFSFVINSLITIGVFVGFAITQNPVVFTGFIVPGASIIGNVVVNINGKKGKAGDGVAMER